MGVSFYAHSFDLFEGGKLMKSLQKQVESIKKDIEKIETYDDVKKFLKSALDIQVLIDLETKVVTGFNISKIVGNESIYIMYDRGYARIEGWEWPARIKVMFDSDKAELICDYLQLHFKGG